MGKKGRVLWLHTQPEHYHNCMMDDLQRSSDLDYIAGFTFKGAGLYKEVPVPRVAETLFLRALPGKEGVFPTMRGKFHVDWRADVWGCKPDVVIVAGYGQETSRELIGECARRGVPVAMFSDSNMRSQVGTGMKDRLKRVVKKVLLRSVIRDVDVMLTANRLGVEYWKYFGAAAEKIVVCPYYADYVRVEEAKRTDRAEVLGKFGLRAEQKVLLSSARLAEAKGLGLMIRAFLASGLAERGYVYVMAGVGPLEKELKELAGESMGKTVFFAGFRQPSENLAMMRHAEAFVLPSVYEPHGIVVQESLAAGTPVIASDVVGAAYDLVEDGVNGIIFRSGDAEELREKLVGLVNDPARLGRMREAAGRKFAAWFEEYSPIKVVDRVAHQLLNKRR